MSNFGEDGLQKLVSMNLFVPETCFFVLGTLKIGGGVVASPRQGKKPIFGKKNGLFWPIFDEKCQILAKTGSRNWSV